MAIIKIKDSVLDSSSADYSATLVQMDFMAELRGANKKVVGEEIWYNVTNSKITLALATQLNSLGCQIEQYPVFFAIDAKTDLTPVGLPRSIKADASGQKTWAEWHTAHQNFYEVEGELFVSHSANGELTFAECIATPNTLVLPADLPVIITEI